MLPDVTVLSRPAKFRAAFASLDIDLSGSLDIGELRALASRLCGRCGVNSCALCSFLSPHARCALQPLRQLRQDHPQRVRSGWR